MKVRWILIPVIALVIISAGQALTTETFKSEAVVPEAQDNAAEAEGLAKKSGCLGCHGIDETVVGPAYREVAKRYLGKPEARAALIQTVKKGGKGHWTEVTRGVPMPAHSPRLTDAEIRTLVDWVLSLHGEEVK